MKKLIPFILTGVLAFSLFVVPGAKTVLADTEDSKEKKEEITAEDLIKGYDESIKDIKDMSCEFSVDMEMTMAISGEEEKTSVSIDVSSQMADDVTYVKGSFESTSAGETEKQELEQYIIKNGDSFTAYQYDPDAKTWEETEQETGFVITDIIPSVKADEYDLEEVKEDKKEYYKVTAKISLAEAMEATAGMLDSMTDSFGDPKAATEPAVVEYYFDKETCAVKKIVLDLKDAMQVMIMDSLNSMFDLETLEAQGISIEDVFKIEISDFDIEVDEIEINKGLKLELPEEIVEAVKNAEKSTKSDKEKSKDKDAEVNPYAWLGMAEMPECDYMDAFASYTYIETYDAYTSGYKTEETHAVDGANNVTINEYSKVYSVDGKMVSINESNKSYVEYDMGESIVKTANEAIEDAKKNGTNYFGRAYVGTGKDKIPQSDDDEEYEYYEYNYPDTEEYGTKMTERYYMKDGDVFAIYTAVEFGDSTIEATKVIHSISGKIPKGTFDIPDLEGYEKIED